MQPTIAFVAGLLSGGGAERQLLYLLRGLSAHPVRVTMATLNPGDPGEAAIEALGIPLYRIPRSRWKVDRIACLASWLRREKPLVVHSWAFYGNVYTAWAGALAGVPVRVGSLQGDVFHETTVQWKAPPLYMRLGLKAPHAVMVNSGAAAEAITARGPRGARLRVVRNGIDLEALYATAGYSLGRRQSNEAVAPQPPASDAGVRGPVLALLGRLIPLKNAPMFLRVVSQLAVHHPGLEGWLIGDGPERPALEVLARELGVAERVRFWGLQGDVARLLTQVDVLCHCSEVEGLSNAIMEGSALGLPVVATRVGGTGEIVDDGATGFLVSPDDDQAMAHHVDRLLRDPELRARTGEAGRQKMQAEFSLERLVHDMLSLYSSLLEERGMKSVLGRLC